MEEKDPTAKVGLSLEVRIEDIPELIQHLGSIAVDRVRIGEQQMEYLEDMEKDQLKDKVQIHSVRNFYHNYFQDETPSSLPALVFNAIGKVVPLESKDLDKKGRTVSVARKAWDDEVQKILIGNSLIVMRRNTKSRRFLEDFQAYLPLRDDKK